MIYLLSEIIKNSRIGIRRSKMEEKKLAGYPSIDKPWMKYYTENSFSEIPECTIYQNIYNHNKEYPKDIALMYFGKKITYAKLFEEVEHVAKALVAQGVKKGDNVALCVPATPETIYAILALNKIGANANMLNPTFTTQQLTERINETGATLMIVANELYFRVESVIPNSCVKTVVTFPAVNSLGTIVKFIKKAKNIPGTIPWNRFIKKAKRNIKVEDVFYQKDMPAIMVYSSGTTGASKGIQLSNDSVNSTCVEGVQIGFPWKRGDKWFSQIPIWFSTGICASTIVPLTYGITIILEPMYDFEVFYQHIQKYKPNFMITACGLLDYLMMKQPKSDAYKEFKFLCAGGEYVAPSAERKYNEWLKSNGSESSLFKGYGMCECGGTVTASYRCNTIGSAGIPTPNIVVSAFDPKTNKELTYGKRGEIRVLSKNRMLGYYKNPGATEKYFWTDEKDEIWCCTGDMGYVNEDGSIFVDGRINESYVNEEGVTIYLFDIERAILDVESVRQCKTVVSKINGKETHIAHVVFFENEKTAEEIIAQIREVCNTKLPENHYPNYLKLYKDALPVSPSGKLNTEEMKNNTENLNHLE